MVLVIVVFVDCSVVRLSWRFALSAVVVLNVTEGEWVGGRVGLGVDDRLKSQCQELVLGRDESRTKTQDDF